MDRVNKPAYCYRIGSEMDRHGESQDQLAAAIGTNRDKVNNWLNTRSRIDVDSLVKIAKHYNVSTDYLLGIRDDPTTDRDLQFIIDYIGLSGDAIEEMHFSSDYSEDMNDLKTMSQLVEQYYKSVLYELGEIRKLTREAQTALQIDETDGIYQNDPLGAVADIKAPLDALKVALFSWSQLMNKIPRKFFDTEKIIEDLEQKERTIILDHAYEC